MADPRERKNFSDIRKEYEQMNSFQQLLLNLQKEELNNINGIFGIKRKLLISLKEYNAEQEKLNNILGTYNKSIEDGFRTTKNTQSLIEKEAKTQQQLVDAAKKRYEWNVKINNVLSSMKVTHEGIANTVINTWKYLQLQDQIIRTTALQLGLSGVNAERIRDTFEQSSGFAARLGIDLAGISLIMTSFADQTNRANSLTDQMVENISLVSAGTGLSLENASKFAGQLDLVGISAKNYANFVQGIAETSEHMGLVTQKVLSQMSSVFPKLQKMTFQGGVDSMYKMVQYSQKFHTTLEETLSSTEKFRGLEGAIEGFANLQVIGGEFAKQNPFDLLFKSRNDPEAFQKSINESLKGLYQFRQINGKYQAFISPLDLDRLKLAAKAYGMSEESLSESALQMNKIRTMEQQMRGTGLNSKQMELIEGMATFDDKSGKFQVQLNGMTRNISSISRDEIKTLDRQGKTLEERAIASQNFDSAFQNTIKELKTALLPFLKGVNIVLDGFLKIVTPIGHWASSISNGMAGWMKIAGGLGLFAATIGSAVVLKALSGGVGNLAERITPFKNTIPTPGGSPLNAAQTLAGGKAAGIGRGASALGIGAGIGIAGLGVGAGIDLAAQGISHLAEAMSKLTDAQGKNLASIVKSLAWLSGIGIVVAGSIIAIGMASDIAAPEIDTLSIGVLGIGAGIGIAAAGIGVMGFGLAKLVDSSKGAGSSMFEVAKGIGAIELALGAGGVSTILTGGAGTFAFMGAINSIAKNAPALAVAGKAFESIGVVLSGTKDQFQGVTDLIASINNLKSTNLAPFAELVNCLIKGLK